MEKVFRTDRFFYIVHEGWYFHMRGRNNVGPFRTKRLAKAHLKYLLCQQINDNR